MRLDSRKNYLTGGLFFAVLVWLPGCSIVANGHGDYDTGFKARGAASWYGKEFQGRLTASGDIYDQHELTAAHRVLALGSRVRVTNPRNGREVEVVINDRGPFVAGRIIDLSYAAAEELGIIELGTSPVVLEVIPSQTAPMVMHGKSTASWIDGWYLPVRTTEWGSRYGDIWVIPAGSENMSWYRRIVGDIRDERRSRRLLQVDEDLRPLYPEAPFDNGSLTLSEDEV
jgi:3D (Asp-Asp-Asp) domain-containing protein